MVRFELTIENWKSFDAPTIFHDQRWLCLWHCNYKSTKSYSIQWCHWAHMLAVQVSNVTKCSYFSMKRLWELFHRFVKKSFEDKSVTAIGFDSGGEQPSKVQSIESKVLNEASCKKAYPNGTPRQFCTISTKGKNTCKLRPSSELLTYTEPASSNGADTLYIIGMLNHGRCGGPILNTNVAEVLSWIVSATPGANYCRK